MNRHKKSFGMVQTDDTELFCRSFSPLFVKQISSLFNVVLEHGYGSAMGYDQADYNDVVFSTREKVMQSDYVMTLKCPSDDDIQNMKKGSSLFSMLHYSTHQERSDMLEALGVSQYSMDSVSDEYGERQIQALRLTARNGIRAAVQEWLKRNSCNRGVVFTIIGSGGVGRMAVDEAIHSMMNSVVVVCIGRNTTSQKHILQNLIIETDILVDATLRDDDNCIIIPENYIQCMPKDSVVLDLSSDPHQTGIAGVPHGTVDKHTFRKNGRTYLSCYSWPGVTPKECMEIYEAQLLPYVLYIQTAQNEPGAVTAHNRKYVQQLVNSTYTHHKTQIWQKSQQ